MKNKIIKLITVVTILPIVLYAENAQWIVSNTFAYEKTDKTSKKTKLNYKKYSPYTLDICDKHGWCKSKDGFVKKYNFKVLGDIEIIEKVKPRKENLEIIDTDYNIEKVIVKDINVSNNFLVKLDENLTFTDIKNEEIDLLDVNTKIDLTIGKFINEVIKRNPSLIYSRLQKNILMYQVKLEGAIFIPKFYVNLSHSDSMRPNNTEQTISRGYISTFHDISNEYKVGFNGLLPYGSKWDISWKTNIVENTLINEYKDYDKEYNNGIEVNFSQPLLKGFGSTITKAKYYLAKSDKEIFDKEYEKKLVEMMGSTIRTYWKFYSTKEIHKSYENIISLNEKTLKLLNVKFLGGESTYSEILEMKSAIMTRKAELKKIDSDLKKIKNDVLSLLNVTQKMNQDVRFNLIDDPYSKLYNELSVEEYFQLALEKWPEYLISKKKLKKEEFQLEIVKNQSLPQLDLVLGASTTTLHDESTRDFYDKEFLSWNALVQFSIPIWNTQSSSAIEMAKEKNQQAKLEVSSLSTGLYNAIETKYNAMLNARDELKLYKDGLSIKNELLKYMNKSFKYGDKTLKDVLEQERDILIYKRRLYNSVVDLKLAELSLEKAVGSLLETYIDKYTIIKIDEESLEKLSDNSFGKLNLINKKED